MIVYLNISHEYSLHVPSNLGVPQRSILGPLLFLLYMNDLLHFINNKSTPIFFASDTSIFFSHSDATEVNSNTHTVFETINTSFENNYL